MKLTAGARMTTLTGKTAEVRRLLEDAKRGAEWFNGFAKGQSPEAGAETARRYELYEKQLCEMEAQEEQRLEELRGRGL